MGWLRCCLIRNCTLTYNTSGFLWYWKIQKSIVIAWPIYVFILHYINFVNNIKGFRCWSDTGGVLVPMHCRVCLPLQPTTATCKPVPCWLVMWIWPRRRGSTFVKKFWPLPASLEISVSDHVRYWYKFTFTTQNLKEKKQIYSNIHTFGQLQ